MTFTLFVEGALRTKGYCFWGYIQVYKHLDGLSLYRTIDITSSYPFRAEWTPSMPNNNVQVAMVDPAAPVINANIYENDHDHPTAIGRGGVFTDYKAGVAVLGKGLQVIPRS